jgi:biotin operon repressor
MSGAPSPTEQAILKLLTNHRHMMGPEIATALNSTPASIKVMVRHLRSKGYNIISRGRGRNGSGYSLVGMAGRSIAPDERDAILADLKRWPLISHAAIAKKYNRSPVTIQRLGRAWGLGRHGR